MHVSQTVNKAHETNIVYNTALSGEVALCSSALRVASEKKNMHQNMTVKSSITMEVHTFIIIHIIITFIIPLYPALLEKTTF